MQVEQGVATVTVSSTSAVVSSTLAAATQTGGSGTGTGSNPSQTTGAASSMYQGSAALGIFGVLASLFL
jgi:hypothetical protein